VVPRSGFWGIRQVFANLLSLLFWLVWSWIDDEYDARGGHGDGAEAAGPW
jgi:hypothetical protein